MDLSRKSWETIRPTAYKGGGTGTLIDDYVGIKDAPLDPVRAEKNYTAAVALNNHLSDRKRDARSDDFWSEKEQKKFQEKGKKGSSPKEIGEDNYKAYLSQLSKWMEELKSAMPRLKKEVEHATSAQREVLADMAGEIAKKVAADIQTNYVAKLEKMALAIPTLEDPKQKGQMQKLADVLVKEMRKKFGIYANSASVTLKAVKSFAETHKIAPDNGNYPKGSWGDDIGKLMERGEELAKGIGVDA